jgi:hypothetical protein
MAAEDEDEDDDIDDEEYIYDEDYPGRLNCTLDQRSFVTMAFSLIHRLPR